MGTVQNAELDAIVNDSTAATNQRAASATRDRPGALLADAGARGTNRRTKVCAEVKGRRGPDIWKSIANLPEALLSSFLKGEHPLTATYILSKLDAALSARVVALLPRELRNQVLCRLLSPPSVVPGALDLFETAIGKSLLGSSANAGGEDNRVRIAEIINSLDPTEAEDVMKALSASRRRTRGSCARCCSPSPICHTFNSARARPSVRQGVHRMGGAGAARRGSL